MAGRKAYYAWGFGGQYIVLVPSLDLVVVSTSAATVSDDRRDHRRTVDEIIEHLIVAPLASEQTKVLLHVENSGVWSSFRDNLALHAIVSFGCGTTCAIFLSLHCFSRLAPFLAAQVTDKDLLTPDPNDFLLYSGTLRFAAALAAEADQHRNVGRLQAKWIFHLTGAKDLEAPPIVYKGVMYIGQYNRVHALDAATGRLIWEHFRQPASVGWQRGIGIYGDMVYMVAQDSALVALDRRTGNPMWEARPRRPASVSRDRCRSRRRA